MADLAEFLRELFLDLYDNFSEVFQSIFVMVIVMIGGFIVSWFIKKLLARLLVLFRFDKWANEIGIISFLQKGGVRTLPSLVVSKIVFWVFIVVFFSFGLNFIGISQFTEYASRISNTLPLIVVSIVIIIIGIILRNFISRVIFLACENADIRYGDPIAKGIRIFLVVITFGIVFEYIGVGNTIITISFLIVFGGIVMTLSLALGIGLSHVVGDFIKEQVRTGREKKKE